MDEEVRMVGRVVGPRLVLVDLLAHEEHRDAGCGEEEAGRHARPASGTTVHSRRSEVPVT